MHPVGTRREREGLGRCAFVAGRGAGRGVAHSRAPDAALPVPKKARQGREGSALPEALAFDTARLERGIDALVTRNSCYRIAPAEGAIPRIAWHCARTRPET